MIITFLGCGNMLAGLRVMLAREEKLTSSDVRAPGLTEAEAWPLGVDPPVEVVA